MEISPNISTSEYDTPTLELVEFKPGTTCARYIFKADQIDPIWLSNQMQMFCYNNNIGAISAPQLGIDLNVIYVMGMESALFNPNVIERGPEEVVLEESSISFKNIEINIKRTRDIVVRYQDAFGETKVSPFIGLTSRFIQRKLDFLEGSIYYNKANRFHRNQAMKRKEELDNIGKE